MLMAVLVALSLVLGPHPAAALIIALAFLSPPAFLALAAAWAAYHAHARTLARRRLPFDEADFLRAVAAEVQVGSSIRQAVAAAADRAPTLDLAAAVHRAAAGRPAAEVAARLESALPYNGRMTAAAYQMVADTGAEASAVFAGLAVRASAAGDIERERRVLTAQARFSAWLVGGLPVAATLGFAATGRGPGLDGPGAVISTIGVALVGVGGLVVWLMVRDS